jgi:hypothetical protein
MLDTAHKTDSLKASSVPTKKLGVFNGLPAAPGQFPFMVSLSILKTDGYTYRCAGVLYAFNLVVTAGKFIINRPKVGQLFS